MAASKSSYQKEVVIKYYLGLHVRPAAKLAEIASKFVSDIVIQKGESVVNAKSPIEILTLVATPQTKLLIKAEGIDAKEAVEELANIIDNKLL